MLEKLSKFKVYYAVLYSFFISSILPVVIGIMYHVVFENIGSRVPIDLGSNITPINNLRKVI